MTQDLLPVPLAPPAADGELLCQDAFQLLARVAPEDLWLANQSNEHTKRSYKEAVARFLIDLKIRTPEELRSVGVAHVLAWRDQLVEQKLSPSTIHTRLSALSSLCRELVNQQLMDRNPVREVKREKLKRERGITPALSLKQARKLLDSPPANTLQGLRDRAILAVGLHVGPRRAEIAKLRVRDFFDDEGYPCLLLRRKNGTESSVAIHPETVARIEAYLTEAGHRLEPESPLFRALKTTQVGLEASRALHPQQVQRIFQKWARKINLKVGPGGFRSHSMRATAGTHALKNGAEISNVRYMLGHADIRTTLLYDRRKHGPENSASFATNYGESKQDEES